MNAQKLQARRAQLAAEYDQNEKHAENAKLMREALHGAIQDCDYWIKELAAQEETARLAAEKPSTLELVTREVNQRETDAIAAAEEREATRETPEERAG